MPRPPCEVKSALQRAPGQVPLKPLDGLTQARAMRVQRQRRGIGLARGFGAVDLLQDRAHPGQGPEMIGVARQNLLDIGHGRTQPVLHEECRGARVPGLGEIGRVIDDRAEMGDRGTGIALAQRILATLEQVIGHRRSRLAPGPLDLALDSNPAILVGLRKLLQQRFDIRCPRILRLHDRRRQTDGCRHDKIENCATLRHNRKIACAWKNARARATPKAANAITTRTDSAMSNVIEQGVEALNEKLGSDGFDGIAKFEIEDEGAIVLDSDGARAGDDDADVTLTASAETFRGMLEGNVNPTMAFMSGQLKIDGDMSLAMKLAAVLG